MKFINNQKKVIELPKDKKEAIAIVSRAYDLDKAKKLMTTVYVYVRMTYNYEEKSAEACALILWPNMTESPMFYFGETPSGGYAEIDCINGSLTTILKYIEKNNLQAKIIVHSSNAYVVDLVEKGWALKWKKERTIDKYKHPDLIRELIEIIEGPIDIQFKLLTKEKGKKYFNDKYMNKSLSILKNKL